ncbi:MAG TPA: hypothetical protein DDZ67_01470 [Xanthomonadaceae bacterium]|nr:hypothetical protein [Xanthomonadaceae bacterium]
MASEKNRSPMTFPVSSRTAAKSAKITTESIASDLKRFEKSGGKIEKLGNTRALKNSKPEE